MRTVGVAFDEVQHRSAAAARHAGLLPQEPAVLDAAQARC